MLEERRQLELQQMPDRRESVLSLFFIFFYWRLDSRRKGEGRGFTSTYYIYLSSTPYLSSQLNLIVLPITNLVRLSLFLSLS